MGKALSGELSCPCDRSCYTYEHLEFHAEHEKKIIISEPKRCLEILSYKLRISRVPA